MTSRDIRLRMAWTLVGALSVVVARELSTATAMAETRSSSGQVASEAARPRPVRNDVATPDREKLGARIVGQWKIVESEQGTAADSDEVYRLVRERYQLRK